MPSPFPGMDPYLEGAVWSDVHQALAYEIRRTLAPHIRPKYFARLAIQTVQDRTPETEIGILYPDVEILQRRPTPLPPSAPLFAGGVAVAEATRSITPALTVPLLTFEVRLVRVEIYDTEHHQLITAIEILSPINKREPDLSKYRHKRERLEAAGVHILEIDLIRRGQRPILTPRVYDQARLTAAHYLITLTRAGSEALEAWPVQLADRLPVVAVPLRAPDQDVSLDLEAILMTIYDQAGYDLSLDYRQPPPPPAFDQSTSEWIDQILSAYRQVSA